MFGVGSLLEMPCCYGRPDRRVYGPVCANCAMDRSLRLLFPGLFGFIRLPFPMRRDYGCPLSCNHLTRVCPYYGHPAYARAVRLRQQEEDAARVVRVSSILLCCLFPICFCICPSGGSCLCG